MSSTRQCKACVYYGDDHVHGLASLSAFANRDFSGGAEEMIGQGQVSHQCPDGLFL